MAQNQKQWSSATPGLLIFMVDQSGSMRKQFDGEDSRSQFAAKAINNIIKNLIEKNHNGKEVRNRCFVMVIGYDSKATKLASGFLQKLKDNPIRVDEVTKQVSDGAGGLVPIKVKMPIWVEPIPEDRDLPTNMKAAFELVQKTIEKWVADKPDNPAPIIINISDGKPYYKTDEEACVTETKEVANAIKAITTEDGPVQIFNAMLREGPKVIFPSSDADIQDDYSRFVFDISTEIPQGFAKAAEKNGLPAFKDGARGAIFNADAVELIKLINFGSSMGTSLGGDK